MPAQVVQICRKAGELALGLVQPTFQQGEILTAASAVGSERQRAVDDVVGHGGTQQSR